MQCSLYSIRLGMRASLYLPKNLITLALFLGWSLNNYAQKLNPATISTNGEVNTIVQDSSHIYVGGNFSIVGYKAEGIASIDPNGNGSFEFPSVGGECYSAVPDGRGGWFVGGQFSIQGLSNLMHTLPDGSVDTSFHPNPNAAVRTLFLDGNRLYAGGAFTQIDGQPQSYLAALDTASGFIQNWNPHADGEIHTIKKDGKKLYVGGRFNHIGGRASRHFAVLDSGTALGIPSISTNFPVKTIEQDPDHIYLGGEFAGANGYYVGGSAMLTTQSDWPDFDFPVIGGQVLKSIPDGNGGWFIGGRFSVKGLINLIHILPSQTLDTLFKPNPNGIVSALFLDGNTLYVGGIYSQIDSLPQQNLAAIHASSGVLQNWIPNPNGQVFDILRSGTEVYVGGNFTMLGGQSRNYIGSIDASTALASVWNPNANALVKVLRLHGTEILAGGQFTTIGGQSRNYLAALSQTTGFASSWDPDPSYWVQAIALKDTTAYVGGLFVAISGQNRERLAEISLSTGNATAWNPGANGAVQTIHLLDSILYVGGGFTICGGQARNNIAAVDTLSGAALSWNPMFNNTVNHIAANGTSILAGGDFEYAKAEDRDYLLAISKTDSLITPWNPNPDGHIHSLYVKGTEIYAAGGYANIGGQARRNLAKLSLSTGNASSWNPDPAGLVTSVTLIDSNIYIGGLFSTVGGQNQTYAAALDTVNGNVLPWDPQFDLQPHAMYPLNQGVLALGAFRFINSEVRNYAFAISKATGVITPWDPNPNSSITMIELNGDHAYMSGGFTQIGGQARMHLAEVSLQTGNANSWDPGLDGVLSSLKRFGNTVYAAGNFTQIGGQPRNYLAALDATTGNATAWNPDPNSGVLSLAISDSLLYVGGSYTQIAGISRNYLTSFKLSTETITSWNPDVNGSIHEIKLSPSRIYVGGFFSEIFAQDRENLASFSRPSATLSRWKPSITGTVNSIIPKGNAIYAGGTITEASGIACNNFAVIHANTGLPELFFPAINNPVKTLIAYDSVIYAGGTFSDVNGIPYGGMVSFSYASGHFDSKVEGITPAFGGIGGDVSFSILGNGFEEGTTVTFKKAGQPDIVIPDSMVFIEDGIRFRGILDLHDPVDTGFWDVWIDIPHDTTFVLTNAFEVQAGLPVKLQTDIVGFDRIRPGVWQTYHIVTQNLSNFDATGIPLYLAVDSAVEVDFLTQFTIADTFGNILVFDTLFASIDTDTLFGINKPFKVYGILIQNIEPFQNNILSLKLKSANATIDFFAWHANPLYGSPLDPDLLPCLDEISKTIIGLTPLGCQYGLFRAVIDPFIKARANKTGRPGFSDFFSGLNNAIIGCSPVSTIRNVRKSLQILYGASQGYTARNEIKTACKKFIPPEPYPKRKNILPVTSFDPNEKIGPTGSGRDHYLPANTLLPYLISCENVDTATAAAQTVLILDTLDQSVFDLATFQLGFFSIADTIVPIPGGLQEYETMIDLRPRNDIIARVKAKLDTQTGIASWEFTSLDPATLEPTINPIAGFLPPNVSKPEGEASVMFSIKAWESLGQDVQIKNKAYIYFDLNAPIITNEWVNTIDTVKPQSRVLPLAAIQSDTIISLKLAGTDIGSGIFSYSIYYSTNGGPFELLALSLADSTIQFSGQADSTYSFFSIATDSVGNVENMKSAAEASTTLTVGIKDDFTLSHIKASIFPNPNQGDFNLRIDTPIPDKVQLTITDALGRQLYQKQEVLRKGENIMPLKLELSGIYFLHIISQLGQATKRIVVNK